MLTGFVTDAAGVCWQLPPCEEWEMEQGVGTPCDSFLLRCPWKVGQQVQTREWAQFHALFDGRRVFTGVVDECEVSLTGRGCFLELTGRGMAALLLDNEAVGQDYQLATPAEILRDHVAPYGIEAVGAQGLEAVPAFRVQTGSSEWTVLEQFLRAQGSRTIRFDGEGRMHLSPWEEDEPLRIGADTPVTALTRRERRYGVLSEVLVRDRFSGRDLVVDSGAFSALGGRARRVFTMPGYADTAEMTAAGREQLQRSAREWEELEVSLPIPFAARPGQLVEVAREEVNCSGRWRVARVTTTMDNDGYESRLLLRRPEYV